MFLKYKSYEWDEINVDHILRHDVAPEEVEEACFDNPFILRGKDGRYLIYGKTNDGRYLFIVLADKGHGVVRTITARDMDEKEKHLYHKNK